MRTMSRIHRQRRWLAAGILAALLAIAAAPAMADDPVPDRTGAFQTTPSAYTVPGYTKPDPAKATPKDLAVAVDAVAQSASRSTYAGNFAWTLVARLTSMAKRHAPGRTVGFSVGLIPPSRSWRSSSRHPDRTAASPSNPSSGT
jgi:hypothetical protein